jgi:hypothetical protein
MTMTKEEAEKILSKFTWNVEKEKFAEGFLEGREAGVREALAVIEKYEHECTLERCGGWSGTSTQCDLVIPRQIETKILDLLKNKQ